MADSGRSQDRDDEVPDPQDQGDPLAKAGRDDDIAGREDQQEPDRGVAPWQSWVRWAGDLLQLVNQILDMVNGSGG
ncbi:hypothetical protein [Streptomyces lavendulocolor]|uniref:hypothetical protein n=1 Tax=Streptomyces lavendulocolor TaxID=67316 RepID=UPI003C2B56D1